MAGTSSIEWTDKTWNPVRGCTRVSPGCVNCYAEGVAARFAGPGLPYEGLAKRTSGGPRWTGQMSFGHDLDAPLRWRKPSRIFVNSMSDLFHERLSLDEIASVYAVCVAAHHLRGHVSQILTKRSARMREVLANEWFWEQVNAEAGAHVMDGTDPLARRSDDARATLGEYGPDAPPPGVWLGVSAEDQQRADERVPDLLATPAAVRFVSAEPLLGPIDFDRRWLDGVSLHCERGHVFPAVSLDLLSYRQSPSETFVTPICGECGGDAKAGSAPRLDWIIVGGESGPGARPMHPDWARAIRDQCAAAGVAFFFKQWGEWSDCSQVPEGAGWRLTRKIDGKRYGVVTRSYDHEQPCAPIFDGREFETIHPWGNGSDAPGCGPCMVRIGKARAGRLLDGRTHDAMPEIAR